MYENIRHRDPYACDCEIYAAALVDDRFEDRDEMIECPLHIVLALSIEMALEKGEG
jgi:hypothetical protein